MSAAAATAASAPAAHQHVSFSVSSAEAACHDNTVQWHRTSGGGWLASLGFLQDEHEYELDLDLPEPIDGPTSTQQTKLPGLSVRVKETRKKENTTHLKVSITTHGATGAIVATLHLGARQVELKANVLKSGKGTPLLRDGIKSVGPAASSHTGDGNSAQPHNNNKEASAALKKKSVAAVEH